MMASTEHWRSNNAAVLIIIGISGQIPDMEIAARLAKVTTLIISRDKVM